MALTALPTSFATLFMYNPDSSVLRHRDNLAGQPNGGVGRGRAQRGFSIMELMVGLTVGLLVVIAGIGSLASTQTSSAVLGDSARLQQTADAVFRNVGYHIAQASALEIEVPGADLALVSFSNVYNGYDATRPYSIHGNEGASSAADTLRVSYQDSGASVDCLGGRPAAIPATANVNNMFSKSTTSDDLMCLGWSNASSQSVASGVKDFQVWYGVRTGIVPGTETFRFYTAGAIGAPPAAPNWNDVRAVRICIEVVGESTSYQNPSLINCQGANVTPTDNLLHRVFWRTYTLRNALL